MHGNLDMATDADIVDAAVGSIAESEYGGRNHFLLDANLKETAARYDLEISVERDGLKARKFSVSSMHGDDVLNKLLPEQLQFKTTSDNVELTTKELKSFLSFLRQPIAASLETSQRPLGHNIARFVTTGHVEIPAFVDEELQDAKSLECHEKGEHKMKEGDVWAMEPEFWNPKELIESERTKIVSSIPGTTYDPKQGFVLNIDPNLNTQNGFEGAGQRALAKEFWSLANQATGNRYTSQDADKIAFSSTELQSFFKLCEDSTQLQQFVQLAQIEEKSQAKLKAVTSQSDDLRADPRFQIALAAKQTTTTTAHKFENIRYAATSCLTPVLDNEATFKAWELSNFTERLMGLSDPVNAVLEEYAVLKMTIDRMAEQGKQSPADLQSMVNQFRPLLSFSQELAEVIENASEGKKKQFSKLYGAETLSNVKEQMSELQTAFDQASVNGVSAGELSSDHEEIIYALKNVFGQNGNILTQTTVGYAQMMKNFWVSAAQSAGDNVPVFAVITGFVGYAWWTKYGIDAQLVQEASGPIVGHTISGGFFEPIGDAVINAEEFKESGQIATQAAIESGEVDECIVRTDCHYNKLLPDPVLNLFDESVKSYLQFRHWVGNDIIASNAMTAQTLPVSAIDSVYTAVGIAVDETPQFTRTSEIITTAGGEVSVDGNMWQDGSHFAMMSYSTTRIAQRGLRGFKQMTGLAAEFVNPTARMVSGPLSFSKRMALQTTAAGLVFTGRHEVAEKVAKHVTPPARLRENLMQSFVDMSAGGGDFALDEAQPKAQENVNIDAATVKLGAWAYGLGKETITIGSDNIKDLQNALNQFGLTLEYSAEDVGIGKDDHKDFLRKKLHIVESAVNGYLQKPDPVTAAQLQKSLDGNLQHILGAELKYADSDEIYNALFPGGSDNLEARRQGLLKRMAAKKEGRINRSDYRQGKWQEARDALNRFKKPEKLASVQSLKYAWGAAVSTPLEKIRLGTLGAASYVGDVVVFAAREGIQEPIAQIPYKKAAAIAVGVGSAIALPLDMAANVDSSLVDAFSAIGATVTSIGSTAIIAGAINLPQDLGLHTAAVYTSGAALGLPWYYAVRKGVVPSVPAAKESLVRASNWTKQKVSNVNSLISRGL